MSCYFLKTPTSAHSGARAQRRADYGLIALRSGENLENPKPGSRLLPGWTGRMMALAMIGLFAAAMPAPANAQQREGDYLYRVETIRAAPGKLEALLNWAAEVKEAGYFNDAGGQFPFLMRHSQGDQWDLIVIFPMESWTVFYSKSREKKRVAAREKHHALIAAQNGLIAFEEDVFAYGPALDEIAREYEDNAFFHIEMFNAAPGKTGALLEQRRMENAYLKATGQTANMIFRRAGGSDVDVFTIGFYENLQAFAAPSGASADEAEAAAVGAGFKNRADISFYLRSLISGHHDTLAVKVE